MYILPALGYLGLALGFIFLTLSLASGLYYLSELVEEHSVAAARYLHRLIYAVILLHLCLMLIDRFPIWQTLLGIGSHVVYARNLRSFPMVRLGDPVFIASCGLVVVNHWVWFRWFGDLDYQRSGYHDRRYGGAGAGGRSWSDRYSSPAYGITQPSFTEIASYFGICVWLVPFALFVSLSAGDNVLPTTATVVSAGGSGDFSSGVRGGVGGLDDGNSGGGGIGGFVKGHKRRNTGMAKQAVAGAREWVGETGAVMGLWRHENVRRFD